MVDLLSYGRENGVGVLNLLVCWKGRLHGHGCFRGSLCQQVVLRLLRQHSVFVFHCSNNLHVEYAADVLCFSGGGSQLVESLVVLTSSGFRVELS